MAQPTEASNIEASVGDVSGQLAIGDNNLQIHAEHGAIVTVNQPEKQPRPSRRPSPQRLRPRPFDNLLDRESEVKSVISDVAAGTPVQVHGPPGAGKTTLLRYLAYRAEIENVRDGVVYLSALNQPAEDLFQLLFDAFYESDRAFKPTDAQLRHYFADTQAVILLDDLDLTREQTGLLLNVAPDCRFVIASSARSLWGEGRAFALQGLPIADGLTLIERELGRELTLAEREAAQTINSALNGQPLRIILLVDSVVGQGRSLVEAANNLQIESRDPRAQEADQDVEAMSLERLSDSERKALSVVAVFGNESVRAQHVAALTGDSATQATRDSLVSRGLLQSADDRYSLAGGLDETISRLWDLTPFRSAALTYFTRWAEEHRDDRDALMKDSGAIAQLMKWGAAAERWEEVIRLGRAVDSALALSGRWGAWAQTLEYVRRGSEAVAGKADIAWAMHQLGTRALCLADKSTARSYLTQALEMRRSLGDQSGANVTQHNLDLLLGRPTIQKPRTKPTRLRLMRFLVSASVVLLAVFGIWWTLPAPVPTVSPQNVEFSDQEVGVRSEPRTVTLSNPHWSTAGISRFAIEGENAEDFSISENNCAAGTIAAGRECTIKVVFVPRAIGNRAAKLLIAAGKKGQSVVAVQLTGAGVLEPTNVTFTPDALNFSDREIGVESEAQLVTITNLGPQPLTLGQASLIGDGAASFKAIIDCDRSVIAAHEVCSIRVTFLPTGPTPQSATLLVTDGSGNDLHPRVVVTGTARVPPTPGPSLDPRPPGPVDFGILEIGSQSPPHRIDILNGGTAPLRISEIVVADGHTDEFLLDAKNCTGATVQPGAVCGIGVRFNPKTAGPHSANLRIADQENRLFKFVLLRGVATAARIQVDPTSIDFGPHQAGEKLKSRSITVSNLGDAKLRIDSVAQSGGLKVFPFNTDCIGLLPSNGQCRIVVSLLTTSTGNFGASIIISSNAVNGTQTIPLNGEVTPQPRPEVKLSSNALDFGAVEVGKSGKNQQLTVYSVGSAPLKIVSVRLSEGHTADFSFSTKCDKSPVAQKSNCTIEIGFYPKAPGSRSAILLISDNTQNGTESIKVLGQGTSVDGWCCAGETVSQTSAAECRKQKGSFHKTQALAELACQKKGACCIDGEQSTMLESECRDRRGIFYSNPLDAKCEKAPDGWCCAREKVFQTSAGECRQQKGSYHKTQTLAELACQKKGVCCIDGDQLSMSESECRDRRGVFYSNVLDALLKCKKREPENGWCCAHGKVFSTPNEEACTKNEGKLFKSKKAADAQCRTEKNSGGGIR